MSTVRWSNDGNGTACLWYTEWCKEPDQSPNLNPLLFEQLQYVVRSHVLLVQVYAFVLVKAVHEQAAPPLLSQSTRGAFRARLRTLQQNGGH